MNGQRLSQAVAERVFGTRKERAQLQTKQRQRWLLLAPTALRNTQPFSSTQPIAGPSATNQADAGTGCKDTGHVSSMEQNIGHDPRIDPESTAPKMPTRSRADEARRQ